MRYNPREKFQSAWLGGFIGEQFAIQQKQLIAPQQRHFSWIEISQKIAQQMPLHPSQFLSWEKVVVANQFKITSSQMVLAVLPMIIYYHDHLERLQFLLEKSAESWQISLSDREMIGLWAYALGLGLREKLDSENLIRQILDNSFFSVNLVVKELEELQKSCDRGLSLNQTLAKLGVKANPSHLPFLLSLYCFYQTPESFILAQRQAVQIEHKIPLTTVLTSVLSGAYNNWTVFPVNWLQILQNTRDYQAIVLHSQRLFKFWSGVLPEDTSIMLEALVATPRSLQHRPHLKIISQTEY